MKAAVFRELHMIPCKLEDRCLGTQGGELWLFPIPGHLSDVVPTQLSQGLTMATNLREGSQGKSANPLVSQAVTDHPAISPSATIPLSGNTLENHYSRRCFYFTLNPLHVFSPATPRRKLPLKVLKVNMPQGRNKCCLREHRSLSTGK